MIKDEKLKIHYAEGRMNEDISEKIKNILENDCQVWLSGVELALSEFSEADLLPNRFFLCGGGSGLPGIKKVLSSTAWAKKLPFTKTPQVFFLQPRDLVNIIDETSELKDPQDIAPMGLANLAIDLVGEEKVLAGILRRAVKMVQK